MERIEPETETHRAEKAVSQLIPNATLPFEAGVVELVINSDILHMPGLQLLVSMLVNQIARMKGIVQTIKVSSSDDVQLQKNVPLDGSTYFQGLENLVEKLSGRKSKYQTEFHLAPFVEDIDVQVGIGVEGRDLSVGCDAWRALLGSYCNQSEWTTKCPLGPYLAATIAASEIFKCLLKVNFSWREGNQIKDSAYSLYNYGRDDEASKGPELSEIELSGLSIAGIGAGGTAALYTLASFESVSGDLIAVEPSHLKESNLGRYLMSDYTQVHSPDHKLDSLKLFLDKHAPDITVKYINSEWHQADVDVSSMIVVSTVDTIKARWDIQGSSPLTILEAGVMGLLFAVLRVKPDGWCLKCKHPPDPDIMWKQLAAKWGLTMEEVKERYFSQTKVTQDDLDRLATVQGKPQTQFDMLLGVGFHEIPAMTECGETSLMLNVPSQAAVLPMATSAAGVTLAAEYVKEKYELGNLLNNYLYHDLRYGLKSNAQKFKPARIECDSESHSR